MGVMWKLFMDIFSGGLNLCIVIFIIVMVIKIRNSQKGIKICGEIKYKGWIFNGISKVYLVLFTVTLVYYLSTEGIRGIVFESTMAYLLLMFAFSFSSKYTITSEGLITTHLNNSSSFNKWGDIMEFKFDGNRKGKYTVINEEGKKSENIVILKKKDYEDIKRFINGQVW